MCVTGGAAAATVTYYPAGGLAPVGVTGWDVNVPLFPNASGGMVPRGHASLTGIYSRECGILRRGGFRGQHRAAGGF